LEKKGIPTVTIVTSAFVDLIQAVLQQQEVRDLTWVVEEHPIAGHNLNGIQKKVNASFPKILEAIIGRPPN
jgi:hypothetical protein